MTLTDWVSVNRWKPSLLSIYTYKLKIISVILHRMMSTYAASSYCILASSYHRNGPVIFWSGLCVMVALELIIVLELISGFLRFVLRLAGPFVRVLALIRYQYGYRCISILLSITLGLAPRCFWLIISRSCLMYSASRATMIHV